MNIIRTRENLKHHQIKQIPDSFPHIILIYFLLRFHKAIQLKKRLIPEKE